MSSNLNPYIAFNGTAKDAMEFYQSVFGGKLTSSTFGDAGATDGGVPADLIMHAQLETEAGFVLMASDTPPQMAHTVGDNISVSLSGDDNDASRGYWDKLSDGANVTMKLEKQMWGDEFGMLVDKFGIPWMVNIAGEQPAGNQ